VRIFGQDVPVKAKILATDALSAHADRDEILRWLRGFRRPPAMTYTVHGEPEAATALAETITRELGWRARPAKDGERVEV
jgi:metallo-beta-lactamase family protein